MIDYLNVRYAEDHLEPVEEKKIEGTVYSIKRWHNETHFCKEITVSDPSLSEPLKFTERVAKFSLNDLSGMLSSQGMQVGEVFGDYRFGAYHPSKTPRLIIIAAKGNAKPADKEKRLYSDGRATDALT